MPLSYFSIPVNLFDALLFFHWLILYQDYFRINTAFMISEGNNEHKDNQKEVDKQLKKLMALIKVAISSSN